MNVGNNFFGGYGRQQAQGMITAKQNRANNLNTQTFDGEKKFAAADTMRRKKPISGGSEGMLSSAMTDRMGSMFTRNMGPGP